MEKLASKLHQQDSIIVYNVFVITFLLIISTFSVKAQALEVAVDSIKTDTIVTKKNIAYEKNKEYILGGISVTGLQKFTEATVKVFTGLKIGQPLKLPGDKLTSAIKKLYQSKQFSTVDVYLTQLDGNTIYLEFNVKELPELNEIRISGVKKSQSELLKTETELKKGAMVTDNLVVTTKNYIEKKYTDKGFLKTKVSINTRIDSSDMNAVNMNVFIDKGSKIKIKYIDFKGNKALSDSKLRAAMRNTKKKFFGRFWKGSKYIDEKFKEDLESILDVYSRLGYRDSRILADSISWNEEETIDINIMLEEGRQ